MDGRGGQGRREAQEEASAQPFPSTGNRGPSMRCSVRDVVKYGPVLDLSVRRLQVVASPGGAQIACSRPAMLKAASPPGRGCPSRPPRHTHDINTLQLPRRKAEEEGGGCRRGRGRRGGRHPCLKICNLAQPNKTMNNQQLKSSWQILSYCS